MYMYTSVASSGEGVARWTCYWLQRLACAHVDRALMLEARNEWLEGWQSVIHQAVCIDLRIRQVSVELKFGEVWPKPSWLTILRQIARGVRGMKSGRNNLN